MATQILAGLDGCREGWIVIQKEVARPDIRAAVIKNLADLFEEPYYPVIIGIDIPIGLTESGPRACDREARKLLRRPRSSSVFPAPIRAALTARNREEASEINRLVDGRGVGPHAWGLYARIREVDATLQKKPEIQKIIFEVHPELAFMEMNGGAAIVVSKKTIAGKSKRLALVCSHFGEGAFSQIRSMFPKGQVQDDDILDAYAVLWSAERIYGDRHRVVPDPPPTDSTGLRMGIWY
jgi:predicted RNase H-like nuclease